jgi:HK97 family phage portal protein
LNIFKKAMFNMLQGEIDDHISAFLAGDDLPEDSGGHRLTIDTQTALKYSAVFACNRVLGETLASMPIMEYKKLGDGEREKTTETAAYDVLHNKPNDEMTPFTFKEASMSAINLGGNAVSQKLYNAKGDLVGLYPYEWQRVEIVRDPVTKKLFYKIKAGAEAKPLQRSEVLHIAGPTLNGFQGLTPLQYIAGAVELGIMYQQYGIGFYNNAAAPSGAFSHPGQLTETAYQRLKKELKKNYTGLKNVGTPMLLEEGMDFKPFAINPIDAQLIENKRFQTEDICRIYRVPLHLVQDLSRSTNNNIEHQSLEFIMYTMLPHFKRWEESINSQLLSFEERKAGYYLEFNLSALLRGDIATRSASYAIGRQWGWLSVNDIRKLENMPSIGPSGDSYLVPLNMGDSAKQDSLEALAQNIYKMIKEGK